MLGIFQSIVLPICLMTGSVPKRVIVCSLAMVLMAAAELTGAVIWVSSTGLEMMNDQLALAHAPLTIFMGLVGYGLVMTPAMLGMGKVVHRFFPDARRDQRSSPASGAVSPVWMRRLALFPLMQVPAYLHCAGYLLQRHARGAGVCCRFRSDFAAVCGY